VEELAKRRKTMGKVVVSQFISLDGVVEDPGGVEDYDRGGWAFNFDRGLEGFSGPAGASSARSLTQPRCGSLRGSRLERPSSSSTSQARRMRGDTPRSAPPFD
jgi:hypothetical protein